MLSDLIDLKRIQHLVLLGDELHFSRAAGRANLSQTAFSRSIQSLEKDLNLRLFDRDTRSVELTSAGRQLLGRARDLLNNANNLKSEADYIATAQGGELKFGASLMVPSSTLQEVLSTLQANSPRLRLDIEINHWQYLRHLLIEEDIEFFVANADMLVNDPRFAIIPLPVQPASIFCRTQHPLALQSEPVSPAQLLGYPWACVRFSDTVATHLRGLFNLPVNTALPMSLNCNDFNLLRHATLNSDSLLFTWSDWLAEDLKSGVLLDLEQRIRPKLPSDLLYLSYSIVQLAGRTLSPTARCAIELILVSSQKAVTTD